MSVLKIYQIDAFASEVFKGNPAAVIPLTQWLPDDVLQKIAAENNLSDTAYFIPNKSGFDLRWLTPRFEVALCGHATLATAHVLFEHEKLSDEKIIFQTKSGELTVQKTSEGYLMEFPIDQLTSVSISDLMRKALNTSISEVFEGHSDLIVIVDNQSIIENLTPDQNLLSKLPGRGVIVSAQGDETDFVSRCFFPKAGIPEDPVTGSAHTTMAAYWSSKLKKSKMRAKQLSERGGGLTVEVADKRVLLTGTAKTFMIGEIFI